MEISDSQDVIKSKLVLLESGSSRVVSENSKQVLLPKHPFTNINELEEWEEQLNDDQEKRLVSISYQTPLSNSDKLNDLAENRVK